MKTKYKYIHFVPGADKTVWTIWNHKSDDYLGVLEYKKRWKEWELCPEEKTGWTTQCLLDVADFIKQLPTTKGGRVQPQVSEPFEFVELNIPIEDRVPEGYRLILAYAKDDDVVLPISYTPEVSEELHNCDWEGCGTLEHVVRFSIERKYKAC